MVAEAESVYRSTLIVPLLHSALNRPISLNYYLRERWINSPPIRSKHEQQITPDLFSRIIIIRNKDFLNKKKKERKRGTFHVESS